MCQAVMVLDRVVEGLVEARDERGEDTVGGVRVHDGGAARVGVGDDELRTGSFRPLSTQSPGTE